MTSPTPPLPRGGGDMGARIRAHDWVSTPLGPPEGWPLALHSALRLCLDSGFPTAIYWGPDLCLLYNDAWAHIPGPRHPTALGRPAREVWADIWDVIAPQLDRVRQNGDGFVIYDQQLWMQRNGRHEESWWNYSFTPILGENGRVEGILNQGIETTVHHLDRRRSALLLDLAERLQPLHQDHEIMRVATEVLARHLNVGRVGFGEVDDRQRHVLVRQEWLDGTMPSVAGWHSLESFSSNGHRFRRGESVMVADSRAERARPDQHQRFEGSGMRSGLAVPVVRGGALVAILHVHDSQPRRWSDQDEQLVREVAGRIWEAVVTARSEAALRESEERHRLIFEQAHDFIFTADLNQIITSCNPAVARTLGCTPEELVGRSITEFLAPGEAKRTEAMLRRKLHEGGSTHYEVEVRASDGQLMTWEINSSLTVGRDGRIAGLHAIARDVTERRRYEEHQELLIHELNHRVKNTLAIVQGLALQTLTAERSGNEARQVFEARLSALAAAHDLLTERKWEGALLEEVALAAIRPFDTAGSRVTLRGPPLRLGPKTAVSIVMALHELATNAAKYGALSSPGGEITLVWTVAADRLRLDWREEGGPSVAPPARRGFGTRMIERALAAELGGTAIISFESQGVRCHIDAPCPALMAREAAA